MPPSPIEPGDILDLKLMPAWVKEPVASGTYADYVGEEEPSRERGRDRRHSGQRGPRDRGPKRRGATESHARRGPKQQRHRPAQPLPDRKRHEKETAPELPLDVSVRFFPRPGVLETVVAQIESDALAYSLFSLARLFLEKPQRYDVRLQTQSELFQLREDGPISVDRAFLEANAFRFSKEKFYQLTVTQSEPLKGNFGSVAKCRLSGIVLGPTNHHGYQPRLRSLYEQRFSRRMPFPEYQRQIEIVTDPKIVEQWKEEARNVATFATLREETPVVFNSAAEAERHFREHYLPGLIHVVSELTVDGVASRQLPDRKLNRHIERAWSVENRSPSNMMQELGKRFREAGLHVFRHRRGMLFVSSIRARPFVYDENGTSSQVKMILETIAAFSRIQRKELGEKLLAGVEEGDAETRKLALTSDLRWLISEGYVIEFNDSSLDLPRAKTAPATGSTANPAPETEGEAPAAEGAVEESTSEARDS